MVVVLVGDEKNGAVSDEEDEPEKLVTVTMLGGGADSTVCVIVTVDASDVVTDNEVTVEEIEVVEVAVGTCIDIVEVDVWVLNAVVEKPVSVTDALEELVRLGVTDALEELDSVIEPLEEVVNDSDPLDAEVIVNDWQGWKKTEKLTNGTSVNQKHLTNDLVRRIASFRDTLRHRRNESRGRANTIRSIHPALGNTMSNS